MIHTEGASVLGTYDGEFYAGTPAVTVNSFGKGKAYYIAARTEQDFLDDFYRDLIGEMGIPRAAERLPLGVETSLREADGVSYRFWLNHFKTPATVDVGEGGLDLASGKVITGKVEMPARGLMILQSKA